jgi:hypothetical protein
VSRSHHVFDTLVTGLPLQPAVELATKADIARLDAWIDEMTATTRALTALTALTSVIVRLIT